MTEAIDTGTPAGSLMFTMMGAIAALERDLVVEWTKAGMHALTHGLSNARVESVNTKLRLLTKIAFSAYAHPKPSSPSPCGPRRAVSKLPGRIAG